VYSELGAELCLNAGVPRECLEMLIQNELNMRLSSASWIG